MPGAVLVVSHTHDGHASEVLARLAQRGAEAVLFDTGRIPRETRLTITHDPGARWGASAHLDGRRVDLAAVRAVWWRRPQPFNLDAAIGGSDDRNFALAETHSAVGGLWPLLDARWMNDPDRDEKAGRKAWQLKAARAAGLRVPRTCVTNDPGHARGFVDGLDGRPVIYKAFSATERTWRETRLLRPEEAELLDAVRYAPVIFQEFVPAQADLRVTVVGDAVFAAAIRPAPGAYAYDFRMEMGTADIAAHALPAETERGLRALMASLGLVYGAIDMRLTPEGEHVFLEVNPAGQWLFIEHKTGQPITEAVAATLAGWAA